MATTGLPLVSFASPSRFVPPACLATGPNPIYGFREYLHRSRSLIGIIRFLPNVPYLLFGRDPGACHIFVGHPSVSGQHACVLWSSQDDRAYIQDLESSGGTFVNNSVIPHNERIQLQPNSSIRFAHSAHHFLFVNLTPGEPVVPLPMPSPAVLSPRSSRGPRPLHLPPPPGQRGPPPQQALAGSPSMQGLPGPPRRELPPPAPEGRLLPPPPGFDGRPLPPPSSFQGRPPPPNRRDLPFDGPHRQPSPDRRGDDRRPFPPRDMRDGHFNPPLAHDARGGPPFEGRPLPPRDFGRGHPTPRDFERGPPPQRRDFNHGPLPLDYDQGLPPRGGWPRGPQPLRDMSPPPRRPYNEDRFDDRVSPRRGRGFGSPRGRGFGPPRGRSYESPRGRGGYGPHPGHPDDHFSPRGRGGGRGNDRYHNREWNG